MKKLALLALGIFLWGAGTAGAREAVFSMGYSLTRSADGSLLLTVTTETAEFGPWLGVTLYPPQEGKEKVIGTNMAFPVKEGKWIKEIAVAPRYRNGTFEIAIWGRRIPKEECAKDDLFCQQNGFRLQGMHSYAWGQLTAP
ncbi:MAG: hypothetical protein M0017_07990 [Desulfobacteraceae bacterium]|nr:hypothetical protein [Desulfobacteraceae bacterium]